jgi:hypothetical protein
MALLVALALVFAAEAEIRGEIVRLGDVADVAALPEAIRAKAAGLRIARFDRDALQTRVSTDFLATQARAQMPALAAWLKRDAGTYVTLRRPRAGVRPLALASRPEGVARGERVILRVEAGPFRIEREGVALDDAGPGEALFVRVGAHDVIQALLQGSE